MFYYLLLSCISEIVLILICMRTIYTVFYYLILSHCIRYDNLLGKLKVYDTKPFLILPDLEVRHRSQPVSINKDSNRKRYGRTAIA